MTRQGVLAEVVLQSRDLLLRGMAGFDESNRTRQAANLPNHVVWNLGHCALTMHRAAERIDGLDLPERDFVTGDGGAGDAERFDTESICFQSSPLDDPSIYPTLARATQIFEAACERLAGAVRQAGDETLDQRTTWSVAETTVGALVPRMAFHNGVHAGQIIDLRRALGLAPLFA